MRGGTAENALPYMNLTYHESMEAHSALYHRTRIGQGGGNQTKAAEFLGLQRTYLARLIKQRKPTSRISGRGENGGLFPQYPILKTHGYAGTSLERPLLDGPFDLLIGVYSTTCLQPRN